MPNTDKVEKREIRSGNQDLRNILRDKRVDYGLGQGKVFIEEVVACARSGAQFLQLASTGERYATKKYLREELTKGRKTSGDNNRQ